MNKICNTILILLIRFLEDYDGRAAKRPFENLHQSTEQKHRTRWDGTKSKCLDQALLKQP